MWNRHELAGCLVLCLTDESSRTAIDRTEPPALATAERHRLSHQQISGDRPAMSAHKAGWICVSDRCVSTELHALVEIR